MARTNGLVAFLGGLGTGYLQAEKEKKDRERQAKMDQIVLDEAARKKVIFEQEQKVDEALAKTTEMKVGEGVRDNRTGAVIDTSQQGFAAKIANQGLSPEQVNGISGIYAKAAEQGGSTKWMDHSEFSQGRTRATSQEDIDKARADAFAQGGAKYDTNRMAALKDAATAKYGESLKKLMAWDPTKGDHNVLKEVYDQYDDGYDIHSETGADGKFYTYYTDKDGNKLNKQAWADPNEFKTMALSHLTDPNNYAATVANMMRFEDRKFEKAMAAKKDRRDEAKTASDLAADGISIKINEGKLANQAQEQKDAHMNSVANRRQSDAAAAASLANANKTKAEAADLAGGTKKLTTEQKTKSADVKAARKMMDGMSAEDRAFLDKGDIGMNAAVSPRQKELQSAYAKAREPDPAMVNVYGDDPHLARFSAGAPRYKEDPVPPVAHRVKGKTYEDPDGNLAVWDGSGWKAK